MPDLQKVLFFVFFVIFGCLFIEFGVKARVDGGYMDPGNRGAGEGCRGGVELKAAPHNPPKKDTRHQ